MGYFSVMCQIEFRPSVVALATSLWTYAKTEYPGKES